MAERYYSFVWGYLLRIFAEVLVPEKETLQQRGSLCTGIAVFCLADGQFPLAIIFDEVVRWMPRGGET